MSDLELLAERLGHRFSDPELLASAVVHASLASEQGRGRGNERLEFLGDAVLDLVVAELLFAVNPGWDEGTLTRARAALVNKRALARFAREIDLGAFVQLGRTEQLSGGAEKDTILADCFEAIVGALYLDGGLGPVRAFGERVFGDALGAGPPDDPKTRFQEWAHASLKETPRYETIGDSGGEQDEQRFRVAVSAKGRVWGTGVGRSKQAAEQEAARDALQAADARDE